MNILPLTTTWNEFFAVLKLNNPAWTISAVNKRALLMTMQPLIYKVLFDFSEMKGTVFFGDRADIFLPLKQTRPTNTSPVSDDRTGADARASRDMGSTDTVCMKKEINTNSFFPAKSEERFPPKNNWYTCTKNCIIRWPLELRFTFFWLLRDPVNEKCKGWTCRYIRAYFGFNS